VDTGGVSEPVGSPFPPGTTEQVIWQDSAGQPLPDRVGAAGGEIVVTYPDGRQEHIMFTSGPD